MSLTGKELIKILSNNPQYKGLTEYQIKKKIGVINKNGKIALVKDLREEAKKLGLINLQKNEKKTEKLNKLMVSNKMSKLNIYTKEINKKVTDLMNIHYGNNIPSYIDKKKFNNGYKKIIISNLPECFADKIDGYGYVWKYPNILNKNGSLTIELPKALLAFPFVSHEYEGPNYDDEIELNEYTITFSKKFAAHIMKLIENKNNYHEILETLKPIFNI